MGNKNISKRDRTSKRARTLTPRTLMRYFAFLLVLALPLIISVPAAPVFAQNGDPVLTLDINVVDPESGSVRTGQQVIYVIDFSCSSNEGTCGSLNITFPLDSELTLLEIIAPPGYNTSEDPTNTVNIESIGDFDDGDAAQVTVRAVVNQDLDDFVLDAIVTGEIQPPDAPSEIETEITGQPIDIDDPEGGWNVDKAQTVPAGDVTPVPGGTATYSISVCPQTLGVARLESLTIVDRFPPGAVPDNITGDVGTPLSYSYEVSDELDADGNPGSDGVDDTITWTIVYAEYDHDPPDPPVLINGDPHTRDDGCISVSYTLTYPDDLFEQIPNPDYDPDDDESEEPEFIDGDPIFAIGASIANDVFVSAITPDRPFPTTPDCPNCVGTSGTVGEISAPEVNASSNKSGPGLGPILSPDEEISNSVFTLNWDLSAANVPTSNFIVQDVFDTASDNASIIEVIEITSGTWPGGIPANIEYLPSPPPAGGYVDPIDDALWQPLDTVNGGSNSTFNSDSTPELPASIQGIRWVFTEVPAGFSPTSAPTLRFNIRGGLPNTDYYDGDDPRQYQNCVAISGTFLDENENDAIQPIVGDLGDCTNFRVGLEPGEGFANIIPGKSVSPPIAFPLQNFNFTLTLDLTQEASGSLINPQIVDVLPYGMEIVSWDSVTFSDNMTGSEQVLPYLLIENIDVVDGDPVEHPTTGAAGTRQQLTFYWSGDPPLDDSWDCDGDPCTVTTLDFDSEMPAEGFVEPPAGSSASDPNGITIQPPDSGSKRITIRFTAQARLDTPAANNDGDLIDYINTSSTSSDSANLVCQEGGGVFDNGDLIACEASATYNIREAARMSSQKWIRSISGPFDFVNANTLNPSANCPTFNFATTRYTNDESVVDNEQGDPGVGNPVFTRFPCVAQGLKGQAFEYLLRAQNTGLVDVSDYVLYDILPHRGDVGVSQALEDSDRESQFRTFMTGPVVVEEYPDGLDDDDFVIEYFIGNGTNYNPFRAAMSNSADQTDDWSGSGGDDTSWVSATTVGTNWGNVTAFRVRQTGGVIPRGEELILSVPMEITDEVDPDDSSRWEAETGEIAWNSFAQRFTNFVSDARLLTAEPRKVGIVVEERFSVGNRVWIDDGDGGGIAGDGILNGDEQGINGVIVELWQDGVLYATDVTRPDTRMGVEEDGYYFFGNLPGGENIEYYVRIAPENFAEDGWAGGLYTDSGNEPGPLFGYINSRYTGDDAANGAYEADQSNDRADNRDSGRNPANLAAYTNDGVRSMAFTLTRGNMSTQDGDVNLDNETPSPGDLAPHTGITPGDNNPTNEGEFGRGENFERDDYSDLTRDFGFYTPMSVGNRVWLDNGRVVDPVTGDVSFNATLWNDGILNGNEQGIAGVRVELWRLRPPNPDTGFVPNPNNFNNTNYYNFSALVTPDGNSYYLTNSEGYYLFDGLPRGTYRVRIPTWNWQNSSRPLYNLVNSFPTFDPTRDDDPDDPPVDTENTRVGAQAYSARPINSPTITLMGEEPTTETDANIDDPDAFPQGRGRWGELDENSNLFYDFGFTPPPMSIGNLIWFDDGRVGTDGDGNPIYDPTLFDNGIRDGQEQGIPDVEVWLYYANPDGSLGDRVPDPSDPTEPFVSITDGDGYYLFENLLPGDYIVFVPPLNFAADAPLDGYLSSTLTTVPDNNAANNDRDHGINDPNPATNGIYTGVIELRTGQAPTGEDPDSPGEGFGADGQVIADNNSILSIDIGLIRPMAIGNRVWLDESRADGAIPGDGIRQADEDGIDDVIVELYLAGDDPAEDDPIASTVTENGGYYLFDRQGSNQADPDARRLGPGDYIVFIPPVNFEDGNPLFGLINSDNGGARTDGLQVNDNIDAVFIDDDNPGDEDGRPADPNDPDMYPIADGTRTSVIFLRYESAPENELDRDPVRETDPNLDSDGEGVADFDSNLTIDLAFYTPPMSIGNFVWYDDGGYSSLGLTGYDRDAAGNGIFDPDAGERGVPGVVVNLWEDTTGDGNADTFIATTTTDADGFYLFDDLPPAFYAVEIDAVNFADTGWNTDGEYTGQLTDEEPGPLFEYGSSIGNYSDPNDADDNFSRDDSRDNGIDDPDPAENGIRSHVFELATFSEPRGEADDPNNIPDPDDPDNIDAYGPDLRGRTGEQDWNSNLTIDFGFVRYMSIGNRVWLDDGVDATAPGGFDLSQRNDGILNGDEQGIPTVRLSLWVYSGTGDVDDFSNYVPVTVIDPDTGDPVLDPDTGDPIPLTTETDGNGYYLFDGLLPDYYIVRVDPVNFEEDEPLDGLASSFDGDPDILPYLPTDGTGNIDHQTTDKGVDNSNVLTEGVISRVVVLDYIIQPVVGNDPAGEGDEGDLPEDTVDNQAIFGPNLRGNNNESDHNSNLFIDFGFIEPAMSIGNLIWLDDGRDVDSEGDIIYDPTQFDDGERNGTEPGIPNVEVWLYYANPDGSFGDRVSNPYYDPTDPDDDEFYVSITDDDGYYLFDRLGAGDYIVFVPEFNFADTGWNTDGEYTGQPTDEEPGPLFGHFSSTGNTDPDNNPDQSDPDYQSNNDVDHGIDPEDPLTDVGVRTGVIELRAGQAPTGEDPGSPGEGFGDADGLQPIADNNSILSIDLAFIIPMAIGNRVWLDDADNFPNPILATAADADDPFPGDGIRQAGEVGIDDVIVELYVAGDDLATATPIASTVTANGGYYLFDRQGNDQADPDARRLGPGDYFVFIPPFNFSPMGQLFGLINSDNGGIRTDGSEVQLNLDIDAAIIGDDLGDEDGIPLTDVNDPDTYPTEVGTRTGVIELRYGDEPVEETDRPAPVDVPNPNGEGVADNNSNLTVDLAFYQPRMSIGNFIWEDDGGFNANGLDYNRDLIGNGIFDVGEQGIAGVIVNLWQDTTGDGDVDTQIATTTTDANGYYLFDNLRPGTYAVQVAPENFADTGWETDIDGNFVYTVTGGEPGPLSEHYSSPGNYEDPTVNNNRDDSRDNGIPNPDQATQGVFSHVFELTLFGEPAGEEDLPDDTPANETAYGPDLRGRYGEKDRNSNLTIDFAFTRYMSIGNRVWLDDGAGGGVRDDGILNGTEAGIADVQLSLWVYVGDDDVDDVDDFNNYVPLTVTDLITGDPVLDPITGDPIPMTTTTDANGYYLFDGLLPDYYIVRVDPVNFQTGGALENYDSSYDGDGSRLPTDGGGNTDDQTTDKGIDENLPANFGVRSRTIVLGYDDQPVDDDEGDMPTGGEATYGPNLRGNNNEADRNSNLFIDFGFDVPRFSVGNFVWYDYNNNGRYDPDDPFNPEVPVEGVALTLFAADTDGNPTGSALATTTTDDDGYYLFDDLEEGVYVVWVDAINFRDGEPLFEYYSSTGVYDDPTLPFDPTADPDDPNAAGNFREDTRDNGIDEDNPGVNGVFSVPIPLFKNQAPMGEDDLPENTPDNLTVYGPELRGNQGQIDSNSDLTRDFGFYKPMSLGNRVWLDANGDGLIDPDESGIAGMTLQLWRLDDGGDEDDFGDYTLVDVTTTDPNGYYLFDDLTPGVYQIIIPAAEFVGLLPTLPDVDVVDPSDPASRKLIDNNSNGVENDAGHVTSRPLTLVRDSEPTDESDFGPEGRGERATPNNSNLTYDFGFTGGLMSLGNRVWFDRNNNGLIDEDEEGIANVTVSLYRDTNGDGLPDGPAIPTTVTDADGYYLFDNLAPGRYIVGLNNSNFAAGGPLDGLRSSNGEFADFTGAVLEDNDTFIRDDNRDNGLSDGPNYGANGRHPVYGVITSTITLTLDQAPTNEDPDDIQVIDGEPQIGADGDDTNSDLTRDLGLYRPMSIGNRIWYDTNDDGIQDPTETGVPGVVLELWRYIGEGEADDDDFDPTDTDNWVRADDPDNPTTTDANGYYIFDGLGEGQYVVRVAPENFQAGEILEGLDTSSQSFADNADRNNNGIPNLDGDGNRDPSQNVTEGIRTNVITLTVNNAPTGETDLSGNPEHGPNSRGNFGETDNNADSTIDVGFAVSSMSIGNRVWIDEGAGDGVYRDGVRQEDEPGVDGVLVRLYAADADGNPIGGHIATATTTDGGYYLFDNLAPGNYVVQLAPSNFTGTGVLRGYGSTLFTADGVTDDRNNGLPNGSPEINGIYSGLVTLTRNNAPTGETDIEPGGNIGAGGVDENSNLTVDFGVYRPMSLGNRVWFDGGGGALTNNGLQDPGEPGIAEVRLELWIPNAEGRPGIPFLVQQFDADGNPIMDADDNPMFEPYVTFTDDNGYYIFDGLPPGDYVVVVSAENFDSGNPLFGMTNSEPIRPDILTGETTTDRNNNGVDEANPQTNGVQSNVFTLELGTQPTNETDLSGNALEHGPNSRGRNGEANNNSNLTLDFGFFLSDETFMSIGNRVWLDDGRVVDPDTGDVSFDPALRNDGRQNGDEEGIEGVTVQLFRADTDGNPTGAVVATTETDEDGYYLFDNLLPGRYVVVIPPSNFNSPTAPLYGLLSSTEAYTENPTGQRDDQRDNGIDSNDPATTGIRSGLIQLVLGNAPTTPDDEEVDAPLDDEGNPIIGANGVDENANSTVDFGLVPQFDWGDAPDRNNEDDTFIFTFPNGNGADYGTTEANDGPRHQIIPDLYIGFVVDAEEDGQPTVGADGDDNDTPGVDDEDGVFFPPLVADAPADVEVRVFNNTGRTAYLIGWIDFDGSGTFDDDEYVVVEVPPSSAPQTVVMPFYVPLGADLPPATGGTTYARFRLTTDTSIFEDGDPSDPENHPSPLGEVSDGEVEDYRVEIRGPGVAMNKTNGQNAIVVGQETVYTVTIRNSASSLRTVTNRQFSDQLPPQFLEGTVGWWCESNALASCVSGQASADVGTSDNPIPGDPVFNVDLNPGGEIVIRIRATLDPTLTPPPSTITNTARLFLTDEVVEAEDESGIIFDPPSGTKVGVVVDEDEFRIRWTMVWFNTGNRETATVSDVLQPGQTFDGNLICTAFGASETQSCEYNAATNTVLWTGIIDTTQGNRVEIAFDVTVPGPGSYTNIGTITRGGETESAEATVNIAADPEEPGPFGIDPAIVKLVEPIFAQPGEDVVWTISVINPHGVPLSNVRFVDEMPEEFEIISTVSPPEGELTVEGQTITFNVVTLQAQQTLTIEILTRLSPDVVPPFIVNNLAVLQGDYRGEAQAEVRSIGELPATGETPDWAQGTWASWLRDHMNWIREITAP